MLYTSPEIKSNNLYTYKGLIDLPKQITKSDLFYKKYIIKMDISYIYPLKVRPRIKFFYKPKKHMEDEPYIIRQLVEKKK